MTTFTIKECLEWPYIVVVVDRCVRGGRIRICTATIAVVAVVVAVHRAGGIVVVVLTDATVSF